jgi:hypothetical protein
LTDLSALGGADGGGDHARAGGTFLTSVRIKKTGGADFHAGVSVDQVMAQQVGQVTPFRSLELSCDTIQNAGECDSGYACIYQHNLAWSSATSPISPETNPRLLFERLFGTGTPDERKQNMRRRQEQQRSILDFISGETRTIGRELSARDNQKLDEYLTGVREIEQRIERAEKASTLRPAPGIATPAGIPASFTEYTRLNLDMLHLAFLTDNTRVATFLFAGDGSNRDFAEIGVPEGHHFCTHHHNSPDLIAKTAVIDHFYVSQLAYFLEKMQQTKDMDGRTLLDNSMIVYGSGNADGNRHTHTDLPVILAGGGGGTLQAGPLCEERGHVDREPLPQPDGPDGGAEAGPVWGLHRPAHDHLTDTEQTQHERPSETPRAAMDRTAAWPGRPRGGAVGDLATGGGAATGRAGVPRCRRPARITSRSNAITRWCNRSWSNVATPATATARAAPAWPSTRSRPRTRSCTTRTCGSRCSTTPVRT